MTSNMTFYIDQRIVDIDEKPRLVIVDENGKITNRNPTKEELKTLKGFSKEDYKRSFKNICAKYTEDELLEHMAIFENREGRIPETRDFSSNYEYPDVATYIRRFGSWNKALEKAFGISRCKNGKYTNEELLYYLRRFEKKNGRLPTVQDFYNNPEYPNYSTYVKRFGNWISSLKLAGLHVDMMSAQGKAFRGRQAEIDVLYYHENRPIDLSGKNWHSYCDAVDIDDGRYDVKSSKLYIEEGRYIFATMNEDKDDDREAIQWYYLVAMNDDNTVRYVWRVPGEIIEDNHFSIYENYLSRGKFTIENMKEYDITNEFKRRIMRAEKCDSCFEYQTKGLSACYEGCKDGV